MKTPSILFALSLWLATVASAGDIGVNWKYIGLTDAQIVATERPIRLLEDVITGPRPISNRMSVTVSVELLPAGVLGRTSGGTYTMDHGIMYLYSTRVKINSLYASGLSKANWAAIMLHEIAHYLAWDETLWGWQDFWGFPAQLTGDGREYIGPAAIVFREEYGNIPMTVDRQGHLGWRFDYLPDGSWGWLGADNEINVDEWHIMDATNPEGTHINRTFWAIFEDQGWTVNWNKMRVGPVELVMPPATRRPRAPVIIP